MNTYNSKYSPGKKINANQYILELICEKNAAITNRELPLQFWKLPQWKSFYGSQLKRCGELLKKYRPDSIIKALRDKRCYKTFSLKGAWLEKVIQEYDAKPVIKPKPTQPSNDLPEGGDNFQRPRFKENFMDKLDG